MNDLPTIAHDMNQRLLAIILPVGFGTAVLLAGGWQYYKAPSYSPDTETKQQDDRTQLTWFGLVDLRHGTTSLRLLRPGRVAKVLVKENDEVSKDIPLVQLDDSLARHQLQEAQAVLQAAEKQLAKAKKLPERHRLQLARQRSAIAAVEFRIAAANHLLTAKRKLHKAKLINSEEVMAAEEQIDELKSLLNAENLQLKELQLQDAQLEVQLAASELARAQARLNQAQVAVNESVLRAPTSGRILRVHVNRGEVVSLPSPQPAIVFAPQGKLIIRAEIEQEFADKVQLGQPVRIEDDSDTQFLGAGKVAFLSEWYLPRRQRFQDPTQLNTGRTLECIISLAKEDGTLRIGQRVRVRMIGR